MTVKLITFKTNHTILGEVKDMPENDYVEVKDCVQIISVPQQVKTLKVVFLLFRLLSMQKNSKLDSKLNAKIF